MKKTALALAGLFLLMPVIRAEGQRDIIGTFIIEMHKIMSDFDRTKNESKYRAEVVKAADPFIIAFLDSYVKQGTIAEAMRSIASDGRIKYESGEVIIPLTSTYRGEDYPEAFSFSARSVPGRRNPSYYLTYGQVKNIFPDPDKFDPYKLLDRTGAGETRIIQYDKSKGKYQIIARFEDTNLGRSTADYGFKNSRREEISPRVLAGGAFLKSQGGQYLHTDDHGKTTFTTEGEITTAVGATHGKAYEVDWILTPQNKLYATEIRWDIKDALDDKGNVIQKANTIKLPR
jgi:hypothetical protein